MPQQNNSILGMQKSSKNITEKILGWLLLVHLSGLLVAKYLYYMHNEEIWRFLNKLKKIYFL